jgi:DNA-binding beta-propeller fold protein YncE
MEFTVSGTGVSTEDQPPIDFLWSNKRNAPEARTESAVAIIDNKIYVVGGSSYLRNYRYDPSVDSWTQLPDSEYGVDAVGGAAVIAGKIYVVGYGSRVQIYDPSTKTWLTKGSLLTPREGVAVAAVNGKLYAIGGGGTGAVEEYDPAANLWTPKTAMPTPRDYAAAAVVGNQIYVIGGRPPSGSQERIVERYDPAADTWSTAFEAMPSRRDFCAVAVLHDKIYVIGGSAYDSSYRDIGANTVEEFDPLKPHPPIHPGSTYTWSHRNPIAFPRFFAVAAAANDKIYVIGGTHDTTDSYGVDVLTVEEGVLNAAPDISLPVSAASFGDVPVGTIGERTFSVQNRGNARLTLSVTRKTGSADYSLFRGLDYLDAGQSGYIRVRFTPTAAGAQSATFQVTSNDPDTPSIDLTLSGTGTTSQDPTGGGWQAVRTIEMSGTLGARAIAIDSGRAYVARGGPAAVTVVDLSNGAEAANISFPVTPQTSAGYLAVSDSKAYLALNATEGQLAIINRDTNGIDGYVAVGNSPSGVAAYGGRVFVTNNVRYANGDPSTVKVVEANARSILASIPVGINPVHVALDVVTGRGYVANACCEEDTASLSVSVFDSVTNQVIASLPMPYAPYGVAISGARAYVATRASVEVIETASNRVIASVPVPTNAWYITATPDNVFVVHNGPYQVTVISTATNAIVGAIAVDSPGGIAVDPATNNVYVTSQTSPRITVIRQVAPSFLLSCNPAGFSFTPTGAATASCTVTSADGFTGDVGLACSNMPGGASCAFNPTQVTLAAGVSATTTLSTNASAAPPGAYAFQANGTSGGVTRSFGLTLDINNPVPALSSLSPASVVAGGADLTLTVNGSNFVAGSTVQWNGEERTTTFVSGSKLTALLPAADLAAPGTPSLTVFTPSPGGGTSGPSAFTITAPPVALGKVSGDNQSAVVGTALPNPLVVRVTDSSGSASATVAVNFAVSGQPAGATGAAVSPTSCITDASGQCQTTLTLGNLAGTYSVTASAANASGGPLAGSPAQFTATAQAATSYLVGDTFPLGVDLNQNGRRDEVGEFGDESLTILDLIYALRAVTSVPGYRPPACSDRFDAIDSHPADTPTVRGGNGTLNTVDLIYTLRRVTNVDTSRPRRYSRNLPCTAGAGPELVAQAFQAVQPSEAAGRLQFGSPQAAEGGGALRIPIYLQAQGDLDLAGLSYAVGFAGNVPAPPLRFVAGEASAPSLVDGGVPGALAVAWLDGLRLAAGQRVLLGYVEIVGTEDAQLRTSLRIFGVSANAAKDGEAVPLSTPVPAAQAPAAPALQ